MPKKRKFEIRQVSQVVQLHTRVLEIDEDDLNDFIAKGKGKHVWDYIAFNNLDLDMPLKRNKIDWVETTIYDESTGKEIYYNDSDRDFEKWSDNAYEGEKEHG